MSPYLILFKTRSLSGLTKFSQRIRSQNVSCSSFWFLKVPSSPQTMDDAPRRRNPASHDGSQDAPHSIPSQLNIPSLKSGYKILRISRLSRISKLSKLSRLSKISFQSSNRSLTLAARDIGWAHTWPVFHSKT